MSEIAGVLVRVIRKEVHYVPVKATEGDKATRLAVVAIEEDEGRFLDEEESEITTRVMKTYSAEELTGLEDVVEKADE